MSHAQKIAVFDASDATLMLLAERRTLGRMRLYLAIRDLLALVLVPASHAERAAS